MIRSDSQRVAKLLARFSKHWEIPQMDIHGMVVRSKVVKKVPPNCINSEQSQQNLVRLSTT